jgi:hypothetical protein
VSRLLNTGHAAQRNDDGTVTYWKIPEAGSGTPAAPGPRSIPRERAARDYATAREAARSNAARFRREAAALQQLDDPANPSPDLRALIGRAEAKAVKQDQAAQRASLERPGSAVSVEERDRRRAAYRASAREVLAESGATLLTPAMRERARVRANGALPEHLRIGAPPRAARHSQPAPQRPAPGAGSTQPGTSGARLPRTPRQGGHNP